MILYTQNYEWQILVNKRPFFKAKWPYSLHIFSLVSLVKKYATCKPIWPFKKAVYSHGSTIHSFFCPIIHFFLNECGKGTIYIYILYIYNFMRADMNMILHITTQASFAVLHMEFIIWKTALCNTVLVGSIISDLLVVKVYGYARYNLHKTLINACTCLLCSNIVKEEQ